MRPLNVLYISQYFPPEMGAPAARVSELSKLWSAAGNHVTVLTGFPNHPTGVLASGYRTHFWKLRMKELRDGVRVERTWLVPLPNRKSWERILNYSSFCVSAVLCGLFLPNPELVIATSPQLLVGLSGLVVSRCKSSLFVLEIRDLWPESLAAVGVSGQSSFLMRSLYWLAALLYRRCDHIVVVSPAFKDFLVRNYKLPSAKISVVTNGVDTDFFSPKVDSESVRAELKLEGKFVVSFIGTIGNAHGLKLIVDAAKVLANKHPEIVFLLVGEGAEKEAIQRLINEASLSNILIIGQQPRNRIPSFIRASDVCLVLLKKSDVFKTVIPTKMLEYMSCERPVILAVEGQAQRLIEDADAGLCIPPEDTTAFVEAIEHLYGNEHLRHRLGINGRNYIVARMSREQTADKYLRLMNSLLCRDGTMHSGDLVGTDAESKQLL